MMEEKEYCNLLIVHSEGRDYVVAAPAHEAALGDLVEFRAADRMTLLGAVIEKMTCQKYSEEWSFVSRFGRIHDAVAIYKASWSVE